MKEKSITMHQLIKKVKIDVLDRDMKDSTRLNSPLKKSDDAIIIDTSNLGINEVIDRIVNIVNNKGH